MKLEAVILTVEYENGAVWENYHLTEKIWVDRHARLDGAIDDTLTGPGRFAATAPVLQRYLAEAKNLNAGAGLTGLGWSFAPLIGMPKLQLDLLGLKGCSGARTEDLDRVSPFAPEDIAFVSAGTTLRDICNWAKPRGKSIMTSGTHLAPTIAGGAATASHGSRLGFGGLQDLIVGLNFVTGPNTSVWVDRAQEPILSDGARNTFATRSYRDDSMFEDCLIHLGGMGIVNGVALKVTDYQKFHVLGVDRPVWPEWLDQMRRGDFRSIAKKLGHNAEPVFYEVTINPANFSGPQALHTCYFLTGEHSAQQDEKKESPSYNRIGPAEAIMQVAKKAKINSNESLDAEFNLLALYASEFFEYHRPPIDTSAPGRGWEEIHHDIITGGNPGALYNASYAVSRTKIAQVIPLICNAVKHLPAAFIFTMRFVSNSSGTLAFTRFPEAVVIEIDGLSEKAPIYGERLGQFTRTASLLVRDALDAADVDYSMHWAKLGEVDASKIELDFGPSSNPTSRLSRWRKTRAELLEPGYQSVFWNRAIRNYGLID